MISEPTPTPRRILVDIDSTLYDSDSLWITGMRQIYGKEITLGDLHQWDWYRRFGLTREDFDRLISEHYHHPRQILANAPYSGAAEVLARWQARGHEIHIVSDRSPDVAAVTRRWLRRNGLPTEHSCFELHVDKFAYVKEHGISLVVDDRPSFLQELVVDAQDVIASTIEQPSNAMVRAQYHQIISAPTWSALARKLERRAKL